MPKPLIHTVHLSGGSLQFVSCIKKVIGYFISRLSIWQLEFAMT